MSPKALNDLGDEVRDEPGLRRPVHVQGPRRRRPHHARQVAVLLRQEEGPPRPDRLQDHHRPAARVRRTCARSDIDVEDRIPSTEVPGDRSTTRACASPSRPRSATRASRSTSATRTACSKPYANVGTPLAKSPTCGRRSSWRSTASRSTRSSSAARSQPDCSPISPASPWYATTKGLQCHLHANVAAAQEAASRRPGVPTPIDVHLTIGTDPIAARLGAGHPGDGEAGRLQRRCSSRPSS